MARKRFGFSLLFITLFFRSMGQSSAEEVVQANLDAYNQRNITQFMKYIHPNVTFYDWEAMKPAATGWQEVKERYQDLFDKSPFLTSQLMGRTVLGSKIIDYEVISGRMGEPRFVELVVVYEVEEQLIKKILVIRK